MPLAINSRKSERGKANMQTAGYGSIDSTNDTRSVRTPPKKAASLDAAQSNLLRFFAQNVKRAPN